MKPRGILIGVWMILLGCLGTGFDFAAERATLQEIISLLRARGLQVMAGRDSPRRVSMRIQGLSEEAAIREIGRQFDLPVTIRAGCYLFGGADTGAVMLEMVRDGQTTIRYLTVPGQLRIPAGSGEIELRPLFIGQ